MFPFDLQAQTSPPEIIRNVTSFWTIWSDRDRVPFLCAPLLPPLVPRPVWDLQGQHLQKRPMAVCPGMCAWGLCSQEDSPPRTGSTGSGGRGSSSSRSGGPTSSYPVKPYGGAAILLRCTAGGFH